MSLVTRRHVLGGAGAIVLAGTALGEMAGHAAAQTADGQGLLAKLQAAKKVRVGIANQPPYSVLSPDGSVSGMGPEITRVILDRLGITGIEGFIGSYGELIPGMLAGRWDFIAACLTTTAARCTQVRFADPLVYDGAGIVYVKNSSVVAPTKIGDLANRDVPVGVQAGGADLRAIIAAGVPQANIRQFNNDSAIIDGLLSGRVQFAVMSAGAMRTLFKQRNLDMGIVFPIPDNLAHGASCAFRLGDTDLHAAFQKELRAMKASGEFLTIAKKNGFESPPELFTLTADDTCKIV